MHEFSLMANLRDKIEVIAREQQAKRINKVFVQLGALCHISEDHFKEHFVEGMKGSVAEGAELHVDVLPDIHNPQAQDILLKSLEFE